MDENITVKYQGKDYIYKKGVTLRAIGADLAGDGTDEVILAKVDGSLQELFRPLMHPADIEFLTTADDPGHKTYKRTAIMVLHKAISDVLGDHQEQQFVVRFSVDKGYYCELREDIKLDTELLDRIKARMTEIVKSQMPIVKKTYKVHDAEVLLAQKGLLDKLNLLKYRRASSINLYHMEDVVDYYYGYMAPDAGYIKYFDLYLYNKGFVLQLPQKKETKVVPAFKPANKLFNILDDAELWGEMMGINNVGELNDCIASGNMNELILVQEALQEKKLAEIADEISQSGKRIVLIAGPSSSGKTTFSHRLSIQLRVHGLNPHPIPVDDYFVDRERTPLDENGKYNFECIEAINVEQFNQDLRDLLAGKKVELPTFDFVQGRCEYGKGKFLRIGENDVLVIEGIHGLNDALTYSIPKDEKYKIYISALTQLNIDDHNRIPTTDGRLIRRIVRDYATRGADAKKTLSMWDSVKRGEEENIFPYQEEADVMFNSALIYELSILKQYVEPLLFSVTKEDKEYDEAKRLLKFLDYFLGVSSEYVPKNSLLREFVGGSCFKV